MKWPLTTCLLQTKNFKDKVISSDSYREAFKNQIIIYI